MRKPRKRTYTGPICPDCGGKKDVQAIICMSCRSRPTSVRDNNDGTATILIRSQKYPGMEATIDSADIPLVESYAWCVRRNRETYYVQTHREDRTTLNLHTLLLDAGSDVEVDHIDRDGLNNRRSNLRPCTGSQNCMNRRSRGGTSRFKGVSWSNDRQAWIAQISDRRKKIHLGLFGVEEEAARAYDEAARAVFGEYGRFNFPAAGEQSALA